MWGLAGVLVLAGCGGRVGFDPLVTGDGRTVDDGSARDSEPAACPSFALLCDDFESGSLGKWTSESVSSTATLTVEPGAARTGTFGLDANVPASTGGGVATPRFVFAPRTTGTIAVRSWVKSMTPLTDFNLLHQFANGLDEYVTLGGDNNGNWVSSDLRMGGGLVDHFTTVPAPGTDVWFCVELTFTFEPAPGRIQGFADDVLVLDVAAIAPSPTFDEVGVAAVRGDQVLGLHVFVDDVVIADRRIGCQ